MSFFLFRWIHDLFNSLDKAYHKLSDEEKQALNDGTGLSALINSMLDKSAEEIKSAIQKKFPTIDEAKLEAAVFHLATTFGLGSFTSLDEAIDAIKRHFAGQTGKAWEIAAHTAGTVFAVLFAPPATKVATIVSFIEYVYQIFVRPKFVKNA